MKFLQNIFFTTLFILSTYSFAEPARTITINYGAQLNAHITAVGAVIVLNGRKATIGTGTYIGNKRILTAGHLFQAVLPKSIPKGNGPVIIDLTKHKIFWTTQPALEPSKSIAVKHRAVRLIIDSTFINEFAGNSEPPNIDDVKSDIAILVLEESPQVDKVSIAEGSLSLPTQASNVGYGTGTSIEYIRHSKSQTIEGIYPMYGWGIIVTNLVGIKSNKQDKNDPPSLKKLLAKSNLLRQDLESTQARQGDSGGPLLVLGQDNVIHIIGVLSAHSPNFNAFASLLIPTRNGFIRNPYFEALLAAAR